MASFFQHVLSFLKPAPPPDPEVQKAFERVAKIVDPMLPSAPGFEKTLALPIRTALDYCRLIVDRIPGPWTINRQTFATDPLVHALFASAEDIAPVVGKSQSVREYLNRTGPYVSECFHALLAARRYNKKTLGVALEGDVMRSDVALEYLYFSDHVVIDSATTEDEARQRIREKTFDSLLQAFRDHLDADRARRQELRDDRDFERGRLSALRDQGGYAEIEKHTRKLAELEKSLAGIVDALQPEEIVAELGNFLMVPECAMQMDEITISVNRSGVVSDPASGALDIDTLRFQQFRGRDRRSYIVLIAAIDRADALEAIARTQQMQQRCLII